MEFNYALERRKFEKQWAILRRQYEKAGMEKTAIDQLYEFDLQWFNSERRYIRRQEDLPDGVTVDDFPCQEAGQTERGTLPNSGILHTVPKDRYWWVNDIDDEKLLRKLTKLSEDDIELLTALVFEGKTQEQIAQIRGCSQKTISNHFAGPELKIF